MAKNRWEKHQIQQEKENGITAVFGQPIFLDYKIHQEKTNQQKND
jgi:hypothetical protein